MDSNLRLAMYKKPRDLYLAHKIKANNFFVHLRNAFFLRNQNIVPVQTKSSRLNILDFFQKEFQPIVNVFGGI